MPQPLSKKGIEAGIKRAKATGKVVQLADYQGTRGTGTLLVKIQPSGTASYWYQYHIKKQRRQLHLAHFPQVSIVEARALVFKASKEVASGVDIVTVRRQSMRGLPYATLKDAIRLYKDSLGERPSATTVGSLYKNYLEPYPKLIGKPARDVTPDDLVVHLIEVKRKAGASGKAKGDSSGVPAAVYTLLNTTFRHIMDNQATIKEEDELLFDIPHNPLASVRKPKHVVNLGKAILTPGELRKVWLALDANIRDPAYRAIIRLNFLLCGQRPQQLMRLKWSDVDFDWGTLTIINNKAKTQNARTHVLPMTKPVRQLLEKFQEDTLLNRHTLFDYVFVPFNGSSRSIGINGALNRLFKEAAEAVGVTGVTVGCIRSTCATLSGSETEMDETQLNRLQSHAIGSSLSKQHYNAGIYLKQKREALELWQSYLLRLVDEDSNRVVELKEKIKQRPGNPAS